MKAVRVENVTGEHPSVGLAEVQLPVLTEPDEVLVRVLCVGLDGTDREILVERYGVPPAGESGLTIGHESLGVVVEAGADSGLERGDLVTALVRRPCREPDCVNCRNGRADYCETGRYAERGIKGAHGYLAEYYKEEARYVVKVPRTALSYGVLAEPQSIVEKVWDQVQRVQQRLIWEPKTVLVLGSGPLGLLAALTCRVLGLQTHVWSLSPSGSRQAELVRGCGAEYHQAAEGAALADWVSGSGLRPDMIWECTGHSPLAFEAMGALGPNGVLALLGVTPGKRSQTVPVDALNMELVMENKCVLGSVNASRKDFETGLYRLKLMQEKYPDVLRGIVTDRLQLEDVPVLEFGSVEIKAVVDVVPVREWDGLVTQTKDVAYSFSV
ncbi:glucose 1-dehydrogenase [Paenibacillus chartarius]|uniref:Glucose 1-dehydrogenase n=1 Tax=Paenibacillus chartarius TaxID=747481 RepID=A0ABV6DI93_9BACL